MCAFVLCLEWGKAGMGNFWRCKVALQGASPDEDSICKENQVWKSFQERSFSELPARWLIWSIWSIRSSYSVNKFLPILPVFAHDQYDQYYFLKGLERQKCILSDSKWGGGAKGQALLLCYVPGEAEKQFSQTKGYRWGGIFLAINANDLNSFPF